MPPAAASVLIILLILEVKHFIFDYPLQTGFQLRNKVIYGHPGGLLHAGLHVLGTSATFLVVRPSLAIGVGLLVGEYIIHYHLDWAKGQVSRRLNLTTKDALYWWAIGLDQLLHNLTYLAIAAILVGTSGPAASVAEKLRPQASARSDPVHRLAKASRLGESDLVVIRVS